VNATGDSVSVAFTASGGIARTVEMHWWPGDMRALQDGDEYRMTLAAPDGSRAFGISQTVTYSASFPNGRECDGAGCRHAEIVAD
jgi:hypothetical protein